MSLFSTLWPPRRQPRESLRSIVLDNRARLIRIERILVMADLQGLRDAAARIASGVETLKSQGAALKSEVEADGAKIKELTDKLASLPPAGTDPATDAAVEEVKAQLNGIADGLGAKVDPVVSTAATTADAAKAVASAAETPAPASPAAGDAGSAAGAGTGASDPAAAPAAPAADPSR